jgi:hypothetical protein
VGNLAGDSLQLRDFVLQQGAMPALLQAAVDTAKLSLLRNATVEYSRRASTGSASDTSS